MEEQHERDKKPEKCHVSVKYLIWDLKWNGCSRCGGMHESQYPERPLAAQQRVAEPDGGDAERAHKRYKER
jgi:hypothetical protein